MNEAKLETRINEARLEAIRFLGVVAVYEAAAVPSRQWASYERAAVKRSAIACGNAMRQINKKPTY